jgi:hypothetical protein
MQRRRHVELDAGSREELCLEPAGENRVSIADDAAGDAVEANDGVEEGAGDRRCGVWVDGNKSLYLVFVGVVFLSILDCF